MEQAPQTRKRPNTTSVSKPTSAATFTITANIAAYADKKQAGLAYYTGRCFGRARSCIHVLFHAIPGGAARLKGAPAVDVAPPKELSPYQVLKSVTLNETVLHSLDRLEQGPGRLKAVELTDKLDNLTKKPGLAKLILC